jgi:hypothetical protein
MCNKEQIKNSIFIANIRTQSQIFKLDCKYSNSMVTTIDLYVLDIVHLCKYLNSMAITIELNKKLQ